MFVLSYLAVEAYIHTADTSEDYKFLALTKVFEILGNTTDQEKVVQHEQSI